MSELQQRIQTAVGDAYRIEKELGGGGMSRVFLAIEIELGRHVVIKVLPPDMAAGVNKERFQREIKLAASLQHPHVVPLLTAGTADADLLYYVMPYIEGESLRAKLAREGELPIDETVKILREVMDALAYAHRHGVVHRDIKPDNVLLSEGHAVVTDFGVAKAVSASSGGTASSLTSMGVALGTPAYMSPEQAAADPHVDHRADIYAVGALAYEMLTGRPPFVAQTPQQVLAAQVSQAPDPVTTHRDTVPTPMADVIMRCLAKRPADRWQTSDELSAQFASMATPQSGGMTPTGTQPIAAIDPNKHHPVRAGLLFGIAAAAVLAVVYGVMMMLGLPDWVFLGAVILLAIGLPIILMTGHHEQKRAVAATTGLQVDTPVGLQKYFTWRKAITGGGMAFAGLAVFAGGYMGMRAAGIGPAATLVSSGVLDEQDLIILAEFENRTSDTTLSSTVTELLRISLSESPLIRLADPPRIAEGLERMQRDANTVVTETVAREIAERENLKAILAGEIGPLGSGYILSARVTSSDGSVLTAQQVTASNAGELVSAVDELSDKLRERVGESLRSIRRDLPLELVTTGSLEALRLYTQATQAEILGDDQRAVALLDEAVSKDSTFAMAYRKIGVILNNNFEQPARVIEAVTKAYEYSDRLTDRERGYAIAIYHSTVTGQREDALAAYRTILDKYPDDDRALNNSGVLYAQLGDYERALEYYRLSFESDSTWAPRFSNIAWVEKNLGRFDDAVATLNAMESKFPGNPRVPEARGFLAMAELDFDSAAYHWNTLKASQRGNPAWEGQTSENLANLAGTRGKLQEERRLIQEVLAAADRRGLPGERVRVSTWWRTNRLLTSADAESATAALLRDVNPESVNALPEADRPYESLVQFYAITDDASQAAYWLGEMERSGQPEFGRSYQRQYDRAAGWAALAAGRTTEGLASMRSGIDGFACRPCSASWMALAHEMAGNADSTALYWEDYLETTWGLPGIDVFARPIAYRRLGELYEARGDDDKAVEYYNEFVDLWADADAELQPQVTDVRERIARLVGERR